MHNIYSITPLIRQSQVACLIECLANKDGILGFIAMFFFTPFDAGLGFVLCILHFYFHVLWITSELHNSLS